MASTTDKWWVALAEEQGLSIGDTLYAAHPGCTSSTKAWVYVNAKGTGYFCNRCSGKGFHPHGTMSIRQQRHLHDADRGVRRADSAVLPNDFTLTLPDAALVWLLKAGINSHEAEGHLIGWSDSLRRVVLPMYRGRDLAYYQARALDGRDPKYINPRVSKDSLLYGGENLDPDRGVVVCEDILSTIRVIGAGYQGVSPLGTRLSEYQAMLLGKHRSVTIWLDPDIAGVKGACAMRKALRWYPASVSIVRSSRDPKLYTDREIKEHITNASPR